MLKRRKSGSSQSMIDLGDSIEVIDIPPPIQITLEPEIRVTNNDYDDEPKQNMEENSQTSNPDMDTYIAFTKNSPLGRVLLSMTNDNMRLAAKTKENAMETRIPELCENFYNAMMIEKQSNNRRIWQAMSDIEDRLINKELNSHKINQSVEPPNNFSDVPTLTTPKQRVDCLKLFPTGSHKFSGQKKDGQMDIMEYLSLVKSAQAQCNLSIPEFYEMLLASTTGKAHLLMSEWISLNEDPATIFHNLLLHFDKRIQPEEARKQLYSYKAPKSSNFSDVEAHIMQLANRATDSMPPGPSKRDAYQMEYINGLIRCLPIQSSILVQNTNNMLSSRLGRAAHASELSKALNLYRHSLDLDIKTHGSDTFKKFQKAPFKANSKGIRHTSYAIMNSTYPNTSQSNNNRASYQTQKQAIRPESNRMRTNARPIQSRQFSMRTQYNGMGQNNGSAPQFKDNRPNPNRMRLGNGKFSQNKTPQNYCSLCGKKDHRAKDGCPNMVDDNGVRVNCFPCHGTCQICPDRVSPRLNHSAIYCPYRKGGPFYGKQ